MEFKVGDKVSYNGKEGIFIVVTVDEDDNEYIIINESEYNEYGCVVEEDLTLISRPIYPKFKVGDNVKTINYSGEYTINKCLVMYGLDKYKATHWEENELMFIQSHKPKEMTVEEIEKELGYKIKILDKQKE